MKISIIRLLFTFIRKRRVLKSSLPRITPPTSKLYEHNASWFDPFPPMTVTVSLYYLISVHGWPLVSSVGVRARWPLAYIPFTLVEVTTPGERLFTLHRLLCMLPACNRNTLFALLHFLNFVVSHSDDKVDSGGAEVSSTYLQ